MNSVHPDSLLFGADCDRLRRLVVCERRCRVSLHGMIERHFRVVLAAFVISLTAVFCRGAMALRRVLVFLRGCGVQVLFDPKQYPLPNGSNDPRAIFPWDALKNAVREMRGHAGLRDHR